ncbi:MAG: hypothetical protein ACRD6N_01125 [Pyrinomonadaceae bacterium]
MAFIGLGVTAGGLLASLQDKELLILILPGLVAFFIGLAVLLNGLLFTLPRKQLPGFDGDLPGQNDLDGATKNALALDTA